MLQKSNMPSQGSVLKPRGSLFGQNQKTKNPFVNKDVSHMTSNKKPSFKSSVGKKTLDPMMSNSTSPFRQNLGGRLTVAADSKKSFKNKENNTTPMRKSVTSFFK